ncbi:MAG: ATP-binding cassette domain-containing protein [Desulfobacterales bacterium]|nr:ATP-binding cassette domain-containing protein [Desulfobacterales bacterium]
MGALIALENASYRYPGGDWVLKEMSIGVAAGDYAVVFGANGSGKSTWAFLPNGLIPHFFGGRLEGRIVVDGLDTRTHRPADLFSRVGLVFQNPDAQLFCSSVYDELAFGLEGLGLPQPEIAARIRRTAADLGIEALLARSPQTLSGGEQRLAAIASVLALDPPLLVLDEPFANLDWSYSATVRCLLRRLHRSGKTVIVIEQRAGEFLQDAGRLFVFQRGGGAHSGAAAEARALLAAHRLLPAYPARSAPAVERVGVPLLAAAHLSHVIEGRTALEDVSFALWPGEVAALVGRNGAGKSTLARHLIGLLKPSAGEVRLHGRSIAANPTATLGRRIGVCFQNANDQFFKPSVREELEVGLRRRRTPAAPGIEGLSRRFRIEGLLERPPYRLSEGQKKQAAIAAVMATDPEVLILDEPTASLDACGKEQLAAAIAALAARGVAVLVATHDLEFAAACADRWILLEKGRVAGDGGKADILGRLDLSGPHGAAPAAAAPHPAALSSRAGVSPLTRLTLMAAGVAAVLATRSAPLLGLLAAAVGVLLLRLGRRRLVGSLQLSAPMTALVFGLGLVFFDSATALGLALRVFSLLGIAAVGFAALPPEELGAALAQLKIPRGPAFMLTAGLRYVPLIEQKLRAIRDAQQARGIDLRPRLRNIANWPALLLPLLVQSFLLADELALAIEARGFSSPARRRPRPAPLRSRDWAVLAGAVLGLGLWIGWESGRLG